MQKERIENLARFLSGIFFWDFVWHLIWGVSGAMPVYLPFLGIYFTQAFNLVMLIVDILLFYLCMYYIYGYRGKQAKVKKRR